MTGTPWLHWAPRVLAPGSTELLRYFVRRRTDLRDVQHLCVESVVSNGFPEKQRVIAASWLIGIESAERLPWESLAHRHQWLLPEDLS